MEKVVSLLEGPQKKINMVLDWQRLYDSPADSNEYIELKLPGAWEPSNNFEASPFGEGKETHDSFLNGN